MKNREIHLLALFSVVLVFSLILPASAGGACPTMPLPEGTSTYDRRTVIDLVAEPEEGYRFVNWTGDANTIGDVSAATTSITVDGDCSIAANFAGAEAGDVGIKAGDWIKLTYNITGWPTDRPLMEWLKLEFLSVEGTTANARMTMHMSDGTEQSNTGLVDLVSGNEAPGLAGIVISPNRTTGDSVYIAGYGNATIEGEATRTYAGANRTVVYAGFSLNETQNTRYWDKLTGVMVEVYSTVRNITTTARATETNMWETTEAITVPMPWWPWIIVGVAVLAGVAVFFVRRRGRGPAAT